MKGPIKQNWELALDKVLELAYKPLTKKTFDWAIIGSVATYLQGCNISPKDLDILVKDPESVGIFASFLETFFLQEDSKLSSFLDEDSEKIWFSTEEKPVDISTDEWNFEWVFARLLIHEVEVEVAHITAPEGHSMLSSGIWEAGPKIWAHIKQVPYEQYLLPVVPLEIQLGTNLSRGLDERINKIITLFQKDGYNQKLLKQALNSEQYTVIQKKLTSIND